MFMNFVYFIRVFFFHWQTLDLHLVKWNFKFIWIGKVLWCMLLNFWVLDTLPSMYMYHAFDAKSRRPNFPVLLYRKQFSTPPPPPCARSLITPTPQKCFIWLSRFLYKYIHSVFYCCIEIEEKRPDAPIPTSYPHQRHRALLWHRVHIQNTQRWVLTPPPFNPLPLLSSPPAT